MPGPKAEAGRAVAPIGEGGSKQCAVLNEVSTKKYIKMPCHIKLRITVVLILRLYD
jgi:hypothetical protein